MTDEIWTLQKLATLISEVASESEKRFDMLEGGVSDLKSEASGLKASLASLDSKIEREIAGLAATVKSGFDELHDRMDGLDGRQQGFQNRLDAFLNHDRRLRRVEKELGIQTVD